MIPPEGSVPGLLLSLWGVYLQNKEVQGCLFTLAPCVRSL